MQHLPGALSLVAAKGGEGDGNMDGRRAARGNEPCMWQLLVEADVTGRHCKERGKKSRVRALLTVAAIATLRLGAVTLKQLKRVESGEETGVLRSMQRPLIWLNQSAPRLSALVPKRAAIGRSSVKNLITFFGAGIARTRRSGAWTRSTGASWCACT